MADETTHDDTAPPSARPAHEPPPGAETTAGWSGAEVSIDYRASAGWTLLRQRDKAVAELFSVAYVAADAERRPVTFVFNGGPGASSAFLHMGAVGPVRVAFPADGSLPTLPARLLDNAESWLDFTDLVFVDPVGTGFSRVIEDEPDPKDKSRDGEGRGQEFFGYKRDLESLCEFMSRWLSSNGRWSSPVFIAGESYGGYRVGRLARMLQENTGIGLSGAVLISPALELGTLIPTDYDVLGWVDLLPTMALAAAFHDRSRAFASGTDPAQIRTETEAFATGEYASFLTLGAAMAAPERERVLARVADLVGLPLELVTRAEGRIPIQVFSRELLRDERRITGLYDATITTTDPFPDRQAYAGADPTLTGIDPAFTAAVNHHLRAGIGLRTDREYVVLSEEINEAWRNDAIEHFFVPPKGATDDLRYGMSLNPHMRTFIGHGRYDTVTPYYTSDRLRNLMRLDPEVARRLTVRHFDGGHMFYAWERSRRDLHAAIAAFVAEAVDAS